MTGRKVTYALKRIGECKTQGHFTEALIRHYHLNLDLMKYMLKTKRSEAAQTEIKLKALVKSFNNEIISNPEMKSVISKKNFKQVKVWLNKMDTYFKKVKIQAPANVKQLAMESEHVFTILNISANKIFGDTRPQN